MVETRSQTEKAANPPKNANKETTTESKKSSKSEKTEQNLAVATHDKVQANVDAEEHGYDDTGESEAGDSNEENHDDQSPHVMNAFGNASNNTLGKRHRYLPHGHSAYLKGEEYHKVKNDLASLEKFVDSFEAAKCNRCHADLFHGMDICEHVEEWLTREIGNGDYRQAMPTDFAFTLPITAITCPDFKCGLTTCALCHQQLTFGQPALATLSGHMDGTCGEMGLILSMWMLLIYFESERPIPRSLLSMEAKTTSQVMEHLQRFNGHPKTRLRDVEEPDERNVIILRLLTQFLHRSNEYDKQTFKTGEDSTWRDLIATVFKYSSFPIYVPRLLDSVSSRKLAQRSKLYSCIFDLLHALTKDGKTRLLVSTSLFLKLDGYTLHDISIEGAKALRFGGLCFTKVPPLMGTMAGVREAAKSLTSITKQIPTAYQSADNSYADLLQAIERFEAAIGLESEANDGKGIEAMAIDEEQVDVVDDEVLTCKYIFKNLAAAMQTSQPNRMRSLMHDIGLLRSSLPEGIWVKTAASRPDIMKALIVGPVGTPYANGLFEFDIFCGPHYPQQPPIVNCPTAKDFHSPLNPNLYADGAVCLSLLHTWHGEPTEMWQPGLSTILQVLISIQAMVLVDNPMRNEPAYQDGIIDAGVSKAYTEQAMMETTRSAIIPWLQDESRRNGLWSSIIAKHFSARAYQVLETIRDWKEDHSKGFVYKKRDLLAEVEAGLARFLPAKGSKGSKGLDAKK